MGKMKAHSGTNMELNELIEAVSKLPNLSFLLEVMLERISKGLGVESAGVMLYDPASHRLELQTPAFGTKDQNKIQSYKVGLEDGGNAVRVLSTGQYEGEIVIGHQVENFCIKEMPASLWKILMSGHPVNLQLSFLLKKSVS